ncbi:hypothetical protein M8C21_010889 [Ambrosia artemisiifolia]|uniref:Uncharacterized protein n=1 Tax=Ambrosia artemisiifolia TaxID=4212 RepID=A0AAD5D9G7_AMBAR|nr:hypothetical protein M8C21_010889 [Ambrosia artemisiifolia]
MQQCKVYAVDTTCYTPDSLDRPDELEGIEESYVIPEPEVTMMEWSDEDECLIIARCLILTSDEIKRAMMDRDNIKKDESIWGGVLEEIGRIEWSVFNKLLGTSRVVLGIIACFSVILAELSDPVFAGRGMMMMLRDGIRFVEVYMVTVVCGVRGGNWDKLDMLSYL